MLKPITPAMIPPPFAKYSHGVEVPAGYRLLYVSGQLGIQPNKLIPDSVEDQADLCFHAIRMVLAEARMDFSHVVRLNAFVTDRVHLPAYMAVRDRYVGDPPPASTLMIVTGFARHEFKVEVEAVAAAPA